MQLLQVPPAELEALILTMDVVKDAIVIPVLDDEAGEVHIHTYINHSFIHVNSAKQGTNYTCIHTYT